MRRSAPLLTLLPPSPTSPVRVIDCDTIELAGERVRLHGIDGPVTGQSRRR